MTKNNGYMRSSFKEDYFRWLCGLVGGVTGSPRTSYRGLLYALFEKEFFPLVPNDSNRASDGVKLREEYIQLVQISDSKFSEEKLDIHGPCRVLEMMVALSRRCEDDIMYKPENGDRTRVWFFSMVKNLGLDIYFDDNFDFESQSYISKVVDTAINRTYSEDGDGGFFPLKNPPLDQRKVEIWYQLISWLNENYFEEEIL